MTLGFRLKVAVDYESMSWRVCTLVVDAFRQKPHMVTVLATGKTPTRAYEMIGEEYRAGAFRSDHLVVGKLDEWYGIPLSDPNTWESYVQKYVIKPLNISDDRFISFASDTSDPIAECQRIQNKLDRVGPIDLLILGLGLNGHIGMNEPTDGMRLRPHLAELAESTLRHSPLVEAKGVKYGMTLGIADILNARRIIMLVSGAHKKQPLRRLLNGDITSKFPASILQMHRDTLVIADRAALRN
ncbi:MAG: 6-phosphogluconolactonase [bacterium]|nr:6-phosphogluconolactonase [bacterium]